jgi:hypothetical protein
MRQRLRGIVLKIAGWLSRRLPHHPLMARLRLFQGARLTRRYLTNLCRSDLSAVHLPDGTRPRPARAVPETIWLIADLYWEPDELIPELAKIGAVTTTDLSSLRHEPTPREQVVELVRRAGADLQPGLILLYAREGFLSEALFDLLRGKNAPVWGMNVDDKIDFFVDETNPHHGRDGYRRWAKCFDLNLTGCPVMVGPYAEAGGRVVYCPPGYHFRPEFAQPRPPQVDQVAFVAAWRETRGALVEHLAEFGISVATHGPGWPGGTMVAEPWRLYRAAQITLGDGLTPQACTTNLKPRDFQTPGANTCYLTTYNWELAEQFEIGREILCYRNADELVEMLAYHRGRPERCRAIAQAGFERARADHTWEKRFLRLIADWL